MIPKYCKYMVSVALRPGSSGSSLLIKEQHEPEPKNHHEARAEKDDPEQ
jgi:hypothetical protein